MKTYISLLRGINAGGLTITMAVLKNVYIELKFTNIQTYKQSGNVIFQTSPTDEQTLARNISDELQKVTGVSIPVLILSTEKLDQIIGNNPLQSNAEMDKTYLHVTFLKSPPDLSKESFIKQKIASNEAMVISDDAVYLFCPNGYGKTKLHNTFLETQLKTQATTRNWKTTNELLRLAKSYPN